MLSPRVGYTHASMLPEVRRQLNAAHLQHRLMWLVLLAGVPAEDADEDSEDLDVFALAGSNDSEGGGSEVGGSDAEPSALDSDSDGEWVMHEPAPVAAAAAGKHAGQQPPGRKAKEKGDEDAAGLGKPRRGVVANGAAKKAKRRKAADGDPVFAPAEEYEHAMSGAAEGAELRGSAAKRPVRKKLQRTRKGR